MQMHPNKAPKPDRMAPLFFIKYWDIIEFCGRSYVGSSQFKYPLTWTESHFYHANSKEKKAKICCGFLTYQSLQRAL